jgi:RNA polymerase sigma factor (sigma-70 family)
MVSQPVSNEALIRRMIPGFNPDRQDRSQAWAEWQESIGEMVLGRYVGARNNTHEADEDIIQDALLTAYLGIENGRYQPQEGVPFVAYVVGIARNKIREARRRERYRVDLEEDREEMVPRSAQFFLREPERNLERREQHDLLRGGLSRLPEARRSVLEHYLSGESTGEIAQRLAMSEALVRQHKCRGLRALQADLQSMGMLGQAA